MSELSKVSKAQVKKLPKDERDVLMAQAWADIKEACDAYGGEAVTALKFMKPSVYGLTSQGPRTGGKNALIELVETLGEVHEDSVFEKFKMGRRECAAAIRNHLKKADPSERRWISFDSVTGIYVFEKTGETPPDSWKGYIPMADEVEDEDMTDEL
jgi:hypothetical protein